MFKIIYTVQLYQFPPYMCLTLSTELPNLTTFIDSNITNNKCLKNCDSHWETTHIKFYNIYTAYYA